MVDKQPLREQRSFRERVREAERTGKSKLSGHHPKQKHKEGERKSCLFLTQKGRWNQNRMAACMAGLGGKSSGKENTLSL